jgi:hypothetical protein
MHSISSYPHALLSKKHTLSSMFCISFSHQVLCQIIMTNSSSSLVVILNMFIISGRYPKIPWLLWQSQLFFFSVSYSQSFWLLWLLSPFLHVTIGGDHRPNFLALHDLGLASVSSFFQYDLGQ